MQQLFNSGGQGPALDHEVARVRQRIDSRFGAAPHGWVDDSAGQLVFTRGAATWQLSDYCF